MKRIKTQDVKNRSRRLTTLFESFTPYTHLPNQVVKVWFGNEISEDGEHSVGHTKGYVKVLVPLDNKLPGTFGHVLVDAAKRFHVEGRIVQGHSQELKNIEVPPFYSSILQNKIESVSSSASSSTNYSGFVVYSVVAVVAILSVTVVARSNHFRFPRFSRN